MNQTFESLGLPAKLLETLARMNFTAPTPIQAEAIPLALKGLDILGSAQTGTGKTGAFCIPLVARMMEEDATTAIIMTPTRELAAQIEKQLFQIIPHQTMRTALLIGGEPMAKQFQQLSRNPRIIVGTPGRINDHLDRGTLKLNKAHYLILDETDRMLDMGFGVQLESIVEALPEQRQTMMFSATLPKGIVKLSAKYLNDPQRISVGSTTSPVANITQEMIRTSEEDKYDHLLEALNARSGSIIVFVKTKHGADKMARRLSRESYTADAIHGDLQQRRRDKVIQAFREKKYRILVATDVAARGLDIPHIEHVINYDLPQCPEDYIHRIGRTARAGAEGAALNLVTPMDRSKWSAIDRLMNPDAKREHSNDDERGSNNRNRNGSGKRKAFGSNRSYGGGGGGYRGNNGGGRDYGSRDGGSRDGGSREYGSRDQRPSRDYGSRDYGSRDGASRDAAPRDRGDYAPRERSNYAPRDGGSRDFAPRAPRGDYAPRDRAPRDAGPRDGAANEQRGQYRGDRNNQGGERSNGGDRNQDRYGARPASADGRKKFFGPKRSGGDFKKKPANNGNRFAARAS